MANTYTQIYIHIVFAVRGRQNLIKKEHKEELHKYITGIVRNQKQKLIAINPAFAGIMCISSLD